MTSTSRAAPVRSSTKGQRRPRAGHCRRLWERLWERRRELGANAYRVLVPSTSTSNRIRGDLDVRVPRRSAWARDSRAVDQGGEVRPELDSAVVPAVRGQPGETVSVHSGVQPWELPSPAVSAQGGQALVAAERAGQADQDGRPSGAARAAIDLSVVRGVGSSMVVPGSVGSYRPVIAGAKLREGTTTILPRGGERSRESACLQCAFTAWRLPIWEIPVNAGFVDKLPSIDGFGYFLHSCQEVLNLVRRRL